MNRHFTQVALSRLEKGDDMNFRMNHIHLKAQDARRTLKWYEDNFGARMVNEETINGVLTLRTDLGGLRVNITEPPAEGLPPGTSASHMGLEHFGLETDDLEESITHLKEKGVTVLEPIRAMPSGMRIAYIEAPDSVRLELMQLP